MTQRPADHFVRAALERWEGPLLRYTRSLTGDLDLARDVVQDAFLRLCTQPRQRVEAHVGEWLFAVCRNRALDVMKKEGRMHGIPGAQLDSTTSHEPPPTAVVEDRDQTTHLPGDVSRLLEQPAVDAGHTFDEASPDFRFAAGVAAFGLVLRESPHKGAATLALAQELARDGVGKDPHGLRRELVELIEVARRLGR